jgi:DNA repair protein RadA/Sms
MEKKLGMHLMGHDVFMNVAGRVRLDEPAVDLGIVAAVASSFLDRFVPGRTLVLGEVGLAGEVRAVGQVDARVAEAGKMGFARCVVPAGNLKRIATPDGIDIVGVSSIAEAVESLF